MKLFSGLVVLLFYQWSYCQSGAMNQRAFTLKIAKSVSPVTIDGNLNETAWQTADATTGFNMKWPNDTAAVKSATSAKMTFDQNYLYISAECSDTLPYIVQSLKRDAGFFDNDLFAVVLDPINQQANGYVFGVNPMNVQYEDLLSATNLEDQDFSWDNKWFSAVKRYPNKWVVEIAIPFKILRYSPGKTSWGVNFIRNDLKHYQYTSWAKIPVQFGPFDLGYTGMLQWSETPSKQSNNITIAPYVTGSLVNPSGSSNTNRSFDAGFDAKLALNSSLNLDITVNPDFSQIEVDRQQINLTRYNIFFPERRTFFLENNDLFFNFGAPVYRPFYSRTIGLDSNANAIPILAGLRLTGNLNKKLRVGLMNMQTRATEDYKAQNYSAVAFNHRLLNRSLFKAYFTNRQAFDKGKGANKMDYGRNAGGEFSYFSKNGTWQGWLAGNWSFKDGYRNKNQFMEAGVGYTRKNFSTNIDLAEIGINYYADMGFTNRIENYDALRDTILRAGFKQAYNLNNYTIRVNRKKVQYHRFINENVVYWNTDGSFNEAQARFKYLLNFTNTGELSVSQGFYAADVLFPFSFTNGDPLPAGKYNYAQTEATYYSDNRKAIYWSVSATAGGFYNGSIKTLQGMIRFRKQPWGNFSTDIQWNELRFPAPYGNSNFLLIRPKIEINFSNNLFWTTFIQYATQTNNFNINSRLQYRFKPMSDIFLVYTDNYFTDPFMKNKNRAVVFKVNYWLNL